MEIQSCKKIEHFDKELLIIDYTYVPIITDRIPTDHCCPFSTVNKSTNK